MKYLILSILILLTLKPVQISAQFLRTSGKSIITAKNERILLKGLTLNGWVTADSSDVNNPLFLKEKLHHLLGEYEMIAFHDAWSENYVREIDIGLINAWGFNCVLAPLSLDLFKTPSDQDTLAAKSFDDRGFQMTDRLITWCKRNKLYLILRMENSDGHDTEEDKASQKLKTAKLWKRIAARYGNETTIAAFNLTHTYPADSSADLLPEAVEIVKAIREADEHHIVILDQDYVLNVSNDSLQNLDQNLAIGLHTVPVANDTLPETSLIKRFDVPALLTVSGPHSNSWYTQSIRLLQSCGVGWVAWPLKGTHSQAPIQMQINEDYRKVLQFCSGQGEVPPVSQIKKALKQLITHAKLEHCKIQKDVLDAMFRQITSKEPRAFHSEELSGDFIIQAVEFDLGRNGAAYYDKDTINAVSESAQSGYNGAQVCGRNDGVDIVTCSKAGSYYVTSFETGEWIQYTLHLAEASDYTLSLTVASPNGKGDGPRGKITLIVNEDEVKNTLAVPNTGGDENWTTVDLRNISLLSGKNVLRVRAKNGGFNFKSIAFIKEDKNFASR